MKELWEKIDRKLDKIDDRLDDVDKTLIKQEANLAEHMRRTELLEVQHDKLSEELFPIKSHVDQVKITIKISAFVIPVLLSIVFAYLKLN